MPRSKTPDRARRTAPPKTPVRSGARPAGPLQRLAARSPAVAQLQALQALADPVQRLEEEELMQGKADPLQRMDEEEPLQGMDEEEPLQGRADPLQRMDMDEDELQMQADSLQRQEAGASTAAQGGLPGDLQAGIEALSGQSLADVRVHRNSPAPATVQAHAFAQGSDIHLAPGQDQHLPHEAWHVVQQREGRVRPTTEVNGAAVNDDAGLETEADRMGQRAAQAAQRVGRPR